MKLNKIKFHCWKNLFKPIILIVSFIPFISLYSDLLKAEYSFEKLEIDSSTKTEENSSIIPTNPFEMVEMIRRYNSMNDATVPSDAIDEALESFNILNEKKEI